MGLVGDYIIYTLTDAVAAIPIVIVLRGIAAAYRRKHRIHTTVLREILAALFFVFFLALLMQTVNPQQGFSIENFWRHLHLQEGINLKPFFAMKQILHGSHDYIVLNLAGNILIFMPIGLGLPLLWKPMTRWWRVTVLGFLLSLSIEAGQLFLLRGTDVDDLILNTVGAVLGYFLYLFIRRLFPSFVRSCRCWKAGS